MNKKNLKKIVFGLFAFALMSGTIGGSFNQASHVSGNADQQPQFCRGVCPH